MSLNVMFASINEPANVIGKTYTLGEAITCQLKQPCSMEQPTLLLNSTQYIDGTTNYCYIQEYDRFYFCTIDTSPQGYVVTCTCDPLESFKDEILALDCVIARNENEPQNMIIDESYVTGAQDKVWFKNFSKSYTRGSGRRFVLITA